MSNAADLAKFANSGLSGAVLQVVQTSINSIVSASAAGENTFNDIAGMSVSITPASTSNKILVSYTIHLGNSTAQQNNSIKLFRGSTAIVGSGATRDVSGYVRLYSTPEISLEALQYLDSPSSTSAVTYKLQWATGSGTIYLNRRGNDTIYSAVSTITVMEIAG
tara:strand:+ start:701 stop:1192 length:492 start_codon:yes stop_codon:yes gene_type:complete